jgi:hypothetical protein
MLTVDKCLPQVSHCVLSLLRYLIILPVLITSAPHLPPSVTEHMYKSSFFFFQFAHLCLCFIWDKSTRPLFPLKKKKKKKKKTNLYYAFQSILGIVFYYNLILI